MSKEHVIFISSAWEWEAGDGPITQGVYALLPELKEYDIHFSSYYLRNHDKSKEDPKKYEELLATAKYVIVPGTPSWAHEVHRQSWKLCMKHKKHLSFLGIGMTLGYDSTWWNGIEDFVRLRDSGLIDRIVCRDRRCYYWICHRAGFDSARIITLPCPAHYMFPTHEVTTKRKIVYAITSVNNCGHSTDNTFVEYYNRSKEIVRNLRAQGNEVFIAFHRWIDDNHPFYQEFTEMFPNEPLHRFPTPQSYIDFHRDKDVYIGVRNHGAFPCGGSGMPSFLMGTDNRHYLVDEAPFISKMVITHADWRWNTVTDWHECLYPKDVSRSLIAWRERSYVRWREFILPIIDILKS